MKVRAKSIKVDDFQGIAEYDKPADAQSVYWELVRWGYDAYCRDTCCNGYLTDEMINQDDVATDAVAAGIERHVPDVCEDSMSRKRCWEEVFHLAHDWLIDHRNYEPKDNEEIALAVADRMFPQ